MPRNWRRNFWKVKKGERMTSQDTIVKLVEAILSRFEEREPENSKIVANEATIYLKTALICERRGIEKAMEYFMGKHDDNEYLDYTVKKEENDRK